MSIYKEVYELSKYSVKDSDYLIKRKVFSEFYKSLKGKQVLVFGGLFKDAHKMYLNGELEVYNYFCDEFRKENIVSAKVHMDETTPHMHLHFIPIRDGKLQCRSVLTQSRLNKVYTNDPKYLQKKEFNVIRGNGKTKERGSIDNIHEYKKEIENILSNELENLEIDLEEHIDALNSVLGIEHIEYKKTLLTSEIKLKNNIFDSMVNSIKNLTIENNDLKENLKMQIKNSKSKSKGMSM